MKIFVNANEESLNSIIDRSFGRCNYFLIYETEDDSYHFVKNPHQDSQESVGAAVAKSAIEFDVNTVLAVNPGPRAFNLLKNENIDIFRVNEDMTLKGAISAFSKNELIKLENYIPYQA
jgi:predicted Fe-Mo cluster-binding NifX family protein